MKFLKPFEVDSYNNNLDEEDFENLLSTEVIAPTSCPTIQSNTLDKTGSTDHEHDAVSVVESEKEKLEEVKQSASSSISTTNSSGSINAQNRNIANPACIKNKGVNNIIESSANQVETKEEIVTGRNRIIEETDKDVYNIEESNNKSNAVDARSDTGVIFYQSDKSTKSSEITTPQQDLLQGDSTNPKKETYKEEDTNENNKIHILQDTNKVDPDCESNKEIQERDTLATVTITQSSSSHTKTLEKSAISTSSIEQKDGVLFMGWKNHSNTDSVVALSLSSSSSSVTIDSNSNAITQYQSNNNNNKLENSSISSSIEREDGVVFMGWKKRSNTDSVAVLSSLSSVKSSNQNQSPPNMKKINILKRSTSVTERHKKNIWQGMLSSNARWRSPNNSNRKTKSPGGLMIGSGEEGGKRNEIALQNSESSPAEMRLDADDKITSNVSETSHNTALDKETTAVSTGSKTNMSSTRNLDGFIVSGKNIFHKQIAPIKTDLDENQLINDNTSGLVEPTTQAVDFCSATPSKQRNKTFGRTNRIIQQKPVKLGVGSRSSDQPKMVSDAIITQKEVVQIKPFHRYLEGFQMSPSELYQEMMRKSKHIEMIESTQLANGKNGETTPIGTLKVELLSCLGLPQIRRSKPNSIAYFVCGDAAFSTDIIQSSLSPMWPARSRRAASFPIFHGYARLYVGIFSVSEKDNDDYIGRSVVDIATLRPSTDYDVALPLRSSGNVYDPKPRGIVRLRLHLTLTHPKAAFWSYIPSKLNEVFINPDEPVELVTIPCAEPKSLRNIAYTVHGEDLPGKYSKKSFRAINRELNLYKFQVPLAFKRTLVHLMTYEKPFASGYIFVGWMSLLYFRVYHLVPSYITSLAIVVHIVNYYDLSLSDKIKPGYQTLSLSEICHSLIYGVTPDATNNKPLQSECYDLESYLDTISGVDIPMKDNLTFPFSEARHGRSSVKSMICPKAIHHKKRIGEGLGSKLNKESSEDSFDGDAGDGDGDADDSDGDNDDSTSDTKSEAETEVSMTTNKMNPTGPEQDDNIETRENSFQENLKLIENTLHSLTGHHFHEQVSRSIQLSNEEVDNAEGIIPGAQANKFTNPLAALSATFLEPIMHVISVYILAVRTIFNIMHWRDPYLSFLFLVMLIMLMILLATFPWRFFFLSSGILLFGPQNYALRSRIESYFGSEDFDEQYIGESTNLNRMKKQKQKKAQRRQSRKDVVTESSSFDRPLFSTHGIRQQKKRNFSPVEVVVPYARARKERFYFWPPHSLQRTSDSSYQVIDTEDKSNLVEKKTQ